MDTEAEGSAENLSNAPGGKRKKLGATQKMVKNDLKKKRVRFCGLGMALSFQTGSSAVFRRARSTLKGENCRNQKKSRCLGDQGMR